MKLKIDEKVTVTGYPNNLYRDIETKNLLMMLLKQSQRDNLAASLATERPADPSSVLGSKQDFQKVHHEEAIDFQMKICKPDPELHSPSKHKKIEIDETFNEYPFMVRLSTPVLSMEEIFINEKGKQALRSLRVKLTHQKKQEDFKE
eukprot:CAMPEP_0202965104 /NCGR_PEP_ID=MMETSP1396-20130829/9196_1 /ASSEMBLY_ACC=CAM_ASM_000872 /TAXON_ID= /ORGANISM="Pseudokeronopsis sp., Strain Brazil" /LENGTH=146 /DNA_ID=CAMNT_0049687721 /DNA_START=430 /DNA_END=870 /DNA_ORIENTATION=-